MLILLLRSARAHANAPPTGGLLHRAISKPPDLYVMRRSKLHTFPPYASYYKLPAAAANYTPTTPLDFPSSADCYTKLDAAKYFHPAGTTTATTINLLLRLLPSTP